MSTGYQRPRQDGDVKAGVVVPAPRAVAAAATADPPHLGRSLFRSAGEVIAMGSVLCTLILAVEATLGGVGFADVEDLEAVADKEVSKPRRRSWRRVWQIVP